MHSIHYRLKICKKIISLLNLHRFFFFGHCVLNNTVWEPFPHYLHYIRYCKQLRDDLKNTETQHKIICKSYVIFYKGLKQFWSCFPCWDKRWTLKIWFSNSDFEHIKPSPTFNQSLQKQYIKSHWCPQHCKMSQLCGWQSGLLSKLHASSKHRTG